MSAFICSDTHISAIVMAAMKCGQGYGPGIPSHLLSWDEVFTMLLSENYRSVNFRYREKAQVPEGAQLIYSPVLPPIVVIKLIHCYQYQSCEHDGWENSTARKWTEELERHLIRALPGYEEAPWGLDAAPAKASAPEPKPRDPYERAYGSRYAETKDLARPEIAKRIRADIKAAIAAGKLPKGKYSVRCESFSGGGSIDVQIKDLGPGFQEREEENAEGMTPMTSAARSIEATVKKIVDAYNYDGSDMQSDHFDVRFYSSISFEGSKP